VCPAMDGNNIDEEVESRLDDLFSESTSSEMDNDVPEGEGYPFRELKTVLLSIEWEITDEIMARFGENIDGLKDSFKKDRILLMLLQLLGSLGEYIKTNKAKAHPNAFKTLSSVFKCMDYIVLSPNISETEKKKLLYSELNAYKELKDHISSTKTETINKEKEKAEIKARAVEKEEVKAGKIVVEEEEEEEPIITPRPITTDAKGKRPETAEAIFPSDYETSDDVPSTGGTKIAYEAFEDAVNEIKQLIISEFRQLREELRQRKKI